MNGAERILFREFRGVLAGALAEDQKVGERIAAEAIRAVQSRGAFARGKQAGDVGHLRVAIHAHAAHHVVRGRADFHWDLRDVDIRELLELVVHAGQLFLDVLGGVRKFFFDPGDVEEHAAVRAAAAFVHFALDAAGHVVAREQFGRTARVLVALRVTPAFFFGVGGLVHVERRNIVEHEALALCCCAARRLRRARLR